MKTLLLAAAASLALASFADAQTQPKTDTPAAGQTGQSTSTRPPPAPSTSTTTTTTPGGTTTSQTPSSTTTTTTAPSTTTSTSTTVQKVDPNKVIGKDVYSSDGKKVGEIDNVLVSSDGQVKAAIVEYGGFLGMGKKDAIVEWGQINMADENKPTISLTEDQLKQQPQYDKDNLDAKYSGTKPAK